MLLQNGRRRPIDQSHGVLLGGRRGGCVADLMTGMTNQDVRGLLSLRLVHHSWRMLLLYHLRLLHYQSLRMKGT